MVNQNILSLTENLNTKVNFDQMNEFEDNILKKIDDISEILIEKFALKKETIKALQFIEERIENLESVSSRGLTGQK